jgi:two-component system sensor histidine kinase YesM
MKNFFSKLSFWYFSIPFRRKTIFFFLLIVLIVSILSEGMGSVFYRNMLTQEISQQLSGTLSKIDDNISQSMNAVEQVSGALYENDIIRGYITADFDSIEDSKNASSVPDNLLSIIMDSNDEISSIYISRANAISLHQGKLFDYAWESIKLSSIFELADQQKDAPTWIYDYYTTSHLLTENNRIVSNARVVYDDAGQPEALILVNLKESAIADALTVESNESGSSYLIMDREGTAVAHSRNSFFDEYTARLPFVDQILADRNSFSFTINGTDYLVNWVSSKDYDWYLVSFTPIQYMDTYMVNILYIVLISFAISMILATILSALFSRSLTSSITRLSVLFPKIEQGDFSVRAPVRGEDEINRLSLQFNNMLTKLQDTINELSKEQVTKQLIEMNALQEQINPHFLYNTLESINSLAILRGYDDISRLVLALSHMLRLSVNKGNSFLTLEQEINHVKNYLYIQNIRYDNKFRLIDAVPAELRDNAVIKLLLQPLIENSILHGFERKEKDCIILIRAYKKGDRLVIKVVDNGSGIPKDKLKDIYTALHDDHRPEKGIYGIYNINQRIRLYYGKEYGIRYASSLGHYTAAIIELRYNDTIGENNV